MSKDSKEIQDNMFKTMEAIARGVMKSLPYCYLQEGTIVKKNKDESYDVRINDNMTTLKKFDRDDTRIYQINDVVKILVENNDTSRKKIIGKKNYR